MKRYYEVDFIKGLAVISMVIFHYFYLGTQMGKLNYNYNSGIYRLMAKFAHLTFIFMVGVNLVIMWLNNLSDKKTEKEYRKKQYKRVIYILFLALIISIITYITFPEQWVKFGILHFIGIGILLFIPFVNKPNIALGISMVLTIIYYLNNKGFLIFLYQYIPSCIAFILGLYNIQYAALDHFSLIKYLPVMGLGIYFGHKIYKPNGRKIEELNKLDKKITENNIIVKIGKYSLKIYVIHFVVLYLLFKYM